MFRFTVYLDRYGTNPRTPTGKRVKTPNPRESFVQYAHINNPPMDYFKSNLFNASFAGRMERSMMNVIRTAEVRHQAQVAPMTKGSRKVR